MTGPLRFSDLCASGQARGKRVFIRADLNVPQDDSGAITEDTRVRASVPCIRMALDAGAAVMVTSHLGRPTEGLSAERCVGCAHARMVGTDGLHTRTKSECHEAWAGVDIEPDAAQPSHRHGVSSVHQVDQAPSLRPVRNRVSAHRHQVATVARQRIGTQKPRRRLVVDPAGWSHPQHSHRLATH